MKIKLPVVIASAVGVAAIGTAIYLTSTSVGVEQTLTEMTVEAGSEFTITAKDFLTADEETYADITVEYSAVDTSKLGDYEVVATHKDEEYKLKVTVADTKAPEVSFNGRYIFTNDIAKADLKSLVAGVEDFSDYTISPVAFEKVDELSVMTNEKLSELEENIPSVPDQEKLAAMEQTEIPTKEGIYKTVLLFEDACGNKHYDQVYTILDTTAAVVSDREVIVVELPPEFLDSIPYVDPAEFEVKDNVDGVIAPTDFATDVSPFEGEERTHICNVSYTDRAGNEATVGFKVVVVEMGTNQPTPEPEEPVVEPEEPENTPAPEPNPEPEDEKPSEKEDDKKPSEDEKPDKEDESKDDKDDDEQSSASEWVESDENLNEAEKLAIKAGFWEVVPYDGGFYMAIPSIDDSEKGFEIMEEYLNSLGLESTGGFGQNATEDIYFIGVGPDEYREIIPPEEIEWEY